MLLSEKVREIFGRTENKLISLIYEQDAFEEVIQYGFEQLRAPDGILISNVAGAYVSFNENGTSTRECLIKINKADEEYVLAVAGGVLTDDALNNADIIIEYIFGEDAYAYCDNNNLVIVTMDYKSFLKSMLDV